jgi:addiction module HigA family antidote
MRAIHPGEILKDQLAELGASAKNLAEQINRPIVMIEEVLNEKQAINPELALDLARYFGNSVNYWLNLQKNYEMDLQG